MNTYQDDLPLDQSLYADNRNDGRRYQNSGRKGDPQYDEMMMNQRRRQQMMMREQEMLEREHAQRMNQLNSTMRIQPTDYVDDMYP